MLIQTVIKRKTTQTTSDYEWLWVTTNDSEWLEKVLHTFIKVHLPVLKELQLPFTTGVKKKLEATVISDEQHQSTSSIPGQKQVDEIRWKFTFYYKSSRCMARYISIHTCTTDYLRCAKFEVHDRIRKHVIRCTKKCVPRFLILEEEEEICFSKQ